jgi:hypothetical protein
MYRVRRYWDDFNTSDPVTQGIALVAIIILVIAFIPYIPVPWIASGVPCTDMSAPRLTGNNQSIYANQTGSDAIRLEIVPESITAISGQDVRFDVRFINESMAPINLFLTDDGYVFRFTSREDGLQFSIVNPAGQALGEPVSARAAAIAPQQFAQTDVHTLRPRSRCTVTITLDPNRLASARVGPGQYRITAVYSNRNRGALSQVGNLTPTPIFQDQGVWVGTVQSNSAILTIGVPAAQ